MEYDLEDGFEQSFGRRFTILFGVLNAIIDPFSMRHSLIMSVSIVINFNKVKRL